MGKRGVHLNDERCFLRSAKWLVCVLGSVVRNFCHSSELFDIQVFISGRLRFTLECARRRWERDECDERCFLRSAKWLVCVLGSVVRNSCHSSELFDIQVFISGRLNFTLECARLLTLRASKIDVLLGVRRTCMKVWWYSMNVATFVWIDQKTFDDWPPPPMFYQKYFRTGFVSPRGVCYSSGLCYALEKFQPRKTLQSLFSEMQMWPMRSSGLNDIPCTVFNQ